MDDSKDVAFRKKFFVTKCSDFFMKPFDYIPVCDGPILHPGAKVGEDAGLSDFSTFARLVDHPAGRRLLHDLCHGGLLAVDDSRLLFHGLHAGPP